jgi:hypothetical protein
MFEPVTITRSTSAAPGAAAGAGAGAGAAPAGGGGGGGGAGFCANAFDAKIKGIPTLAMRAARTNPTLFSTFFIISFSIGLVRFA